MLSMWFAELITEEKLGNGSSMIIFINIIGGIPAELNKTQFFANESSFLNNLVTTGESLLIYFFIVLIVIVFQDAYKRIDIISAKQLSFTNSNQSQDLSELKSSFIPLKINLGGIMPLVFSSTVSAILVYPVQALFATIASAGILSQVVPFYSFALNVTLIVFFSCFYAVIVLKPGDISQNLAKSAYTIPGVRQGDTTTKYLEQTINRLSFMGGLFLAFLAFSPLVIGNLFQLRLFRNITSLLILIGVITDVTSQIQGYLVSQKYETFKKAN
jgi:preprotein translocase subunit SecY